MCSAMARDAPSFNPFCTMALNSTPCSSITPSEFTNIFPNAKLVMLLNATAPKCFLNNIPFPKFSGQILHKYTFGKLKCTSNFMIFFKRIGKLYLNIIFFHEYIELRITTYNDS
ncbi:hypothetical protein AAZX31_19G047300 [Glycine max]